MIWLLGVAKLEKLNIIEIWWTHIFHEAHTYTNVERAIPQFIEIAMMAKSLEGSTNNWQPSIFMSSDSVVKRLIDTTKKKTCYVYLYVVQLEIIVFLG